VNQLLRYLRAASPVSAAAETPDRELLARFARARDATAFAALVSRHGSAVWATCRRLLDRAEDAEDAFQAVFLTLARKANSVSGDVLAAWLHGVARRVAANVRRDERRRAVIESAARMPEGRAADLSWCEGLAVLDEELARLPDRYRTVLIVCCLDGRTRDEAARQLGYSEGQVKGLLERARELLRQRLARRGFEFGAVLLAATVTSAAGAAPDLSAEIALRAAQGVGTAGGLSSAAVALSEKVVNAMFVQKLKAVTTALIVAAVAVGGAFVPGAATGTEPGKKGKVEPGHAFAPRGGLAVTDDPLMGPSQPVAPQKSAPQKPRTDSGFDPFAAWKPYGYDPNEYVPPARDTVDAPKVYIEGEFPSKMLRELGNRFDVEVLGRTEGTCSGTELYFYDSELGTAAVHAGLVKAGEKAIITVTVVKCPKSGAGSTRNGVKSQPWDEARPTDTALVLQRVPKAAQVPAVEKDALTVGEAIRAKRGEKVTVKFEVGNSQYAWTTAFGAKETRVVTFVPKEKLTGGDTFRVLVTDKAATALFNLGLIDEHLAGTSYDRGVSAYFQGKTVRVTGKVEELEQTTKGTAYRLVISDLENLKVVK
jgi:RNA polymerase sigma factor (sigma-70 family)